MPPQSAGSHQLDFHSACKAIIETTFSQLTEQLHAQRVLVKTFSELSLRLLTKFLAYNLCMLLAQSSCIKS